MPTRTRSFWQVCLHALAAGLVLELDLGQGMGLGFGAGVARAAAEPGPESEPGERARSAGLLTQMVVRALREGPRAWTPADRAVARGNRPCTVHEEIEEMLATPRPWLPAGPTDPSGSNPAIALCYSRERPPAPEVIARVESNLYQLLPQYNVSSRWTRTAVNLSGVGVAGDPITLTWSLAPDGLSITSDGVGEGTQPNRLFAQMDARFGGNRALWLQRVGEVFARWGQVTGNTYIRETFGGNDWDDGAAWGQQGVRFRRGDVRIAMKNLDGVDGVLAYNSFPPDGGDMVLDAAEDWGQPEQNHRFMRNILSHEHGHGLGFAHTCPDDSTKLMEPFLSLSYDGPQEDDIRAGQRNYGDRNENDDTAQTAKFFGSFGPGGAANLGDLPAPAVAGASTLALEGNAQQDWHRFTLTQPLLVTLTLTPVGSVYLDLDQAGDGSCPQEGPPAPIDSRRIADLAIEVYEPDGVSFVVDTDTAGLGAPETLTSLLRPAGNTLVRVVASNLPAGSQSYKLALRAGPALTLTASNGTFTDRVRLNWTAIPGAGHFVFRSTSTERADAVQLNLNPVTGAQLDDLSAVPGQAYFYWVAASQIGGTQYDFAGPVAGARGLPANVNPVARAGADQVVNDTDGSGSEIVNLSGAASTDADGSIVNYRWSEGATTLANGPSPLASVELATGSHTITLTVTDNRGGTSADTLIVRVNAPPVAAAGPDQVVTDLDRSGSEAVTLNGGASSDPENAIVNYAWREGAATLASGPSAVALVNLAVGPHAITLTVTDADGLSRTDQVAITVNARPIARAGPDQTVTDSDRSGAEDVTLDGSASQDAEGPIANFRWTQGAGVGVGTVLANGPGAAQPVVSLPVGTHPITLTVTDSTGATDSDTVVVTVSALPPLCRADFSGDGSIDPDDLADFITCYFSIPPCPQADFSGDGTSDPDDLADFITTYFAGC